MQPATMDGEVRHAMPGPDATRHDARLAGPCEGGDRPPKILRAVEFLTALPRTGTGKLQGFALRRLALAGTSGGNSEGRSA
jgi:acyl-coenzyme A synthetase/AMP-(fatty) acid ligase